ncbi:sigma-70 family RNA polymerase sigma factor [Rhodoferax saidenbachensis]|uniref:RNA polymerase sigma factor (Sigma-70 family) n=1 Tax=Rhodoferax saidenbachensis TaxID=1484693 RepID=A0ABU1ZPJ1_9BURK|nr:sigma-70 family RNA polymerase sigma factor [Rhodoferax saidenbachensis]MDR7307308.1 RNA polymerase sigma factor (sigma-70 family) [Rhodoferax saidenbachensis]
MASPASQQVLVSAHAGDPGALDTLLRVCRPDVRRYAQRHCLVSDVDDAVQEALMVLSRKLHSVRTLAAFSGWLFQVVKRECRRLGRLAIAYDPWDEAAVAAWAARHSDDALRMDLVSALQSLPPQYLEVILLRDFEELSIAEIAAQLGLTAAATKSRLHRARTLTREYLLAD